MSNNENPEVKAAAPNALQDFTTCPEWGQGGQFIYDPVTKTRTRVEPPADESNAAETTLKADQAAQDEAAVTTTTTRKERSRA